MPAAQRILMCLSIISIALPNAAIAVPITLSVPFSTQAPDGNWNQPWQDACEETAITLVDNYYRKATNQPRLAIDTAREEIYRAYRIKTNYFGFSLDETADTIVEWINLFYPWEAYVVDHPTTDRMKIELDQNRPIILPAYGTALDNPHFLSPLLDYHVIVLKGYDDETQEFIAHDPGTRFGLDIRYSYDTIQAAMHDFELDNMPHTRKVAIFTSPTITARSAHTDGDNDRMTKAQELLYQTILWLSDSDGDSFLDGTEMLFGYAPTQSTPTTLPYMLVKSATHPEVYLVRHGKKMHIPNEQAFRAAGYHWGDIRIVGGDILSHIEDIPYY